MIIELVSAQKTIQEQLSTLLKSKQNINDKSNKDGGTKGLTIDETKIIELFVKLNSHANHTQISNKLEPNQAPIEANVQTNPKE